MKVKIIKSMVNENCGTYASIEKYIDGVYDADEEEDGTIRFYPEINNKEFSLPLLIGEFEIVK